MIDDDNLLFDFAMPEKTESSAVPTKAPSVVIPDTVAELEREIQRCNDLYWKQNAPDTPDDVYDAMVEKLRRLSPNNPLLTQIGGGDIFSAELDTETQKVRHPEPMLSLDKAYSLEALLAWAKKYARTADELLLVQPKYDGISARFDGTTLSTRGDGRIGENITDKLPLIELETIGYTGKVDRAVLGELVLRNDRFAEISAKLTNSDGTPFFKNSRNAVPAILRRDDVRVLKHIGVKLTLADYAVQSIAVPANELAERWEGLLEHMNSLPYPQDGIVVKIADEKYRKELGFNEHHPYGAIAFKFSNIAKETVLLGVEWSFGKNCLTPVANLEPVEFDGVTVKRATLHNAQNVLDMDIMIGDRVIVERAGDVIPHITERFPGSDRRSPMIDICPSCQSKLARRGPELCCVNPDCQETALQRLLAAVKNLGIEELGEPTLRLLMTQKKIRHLADLFALTKDDLLQIRSSGGEKKAARPADDLFADDLFGDTAPVAEEPTDSGADGNFRFAQKSATKLIEHIQSARVTEAWRILSALNIPGIGPKLARTLLENRTFQELQAMTEAELAEISGVGPERAHAVVSELVAQKDYLDELLAALSIVNGDTTVAPSGKTICFTGKMPEKRSYYEKLAATRGYTGVSVVTRDCSLLVTADRSEKSGKTRNAEKYGVKIVTLDEFLAMIEAE